MNRKILIWKGTSVISIETVVSLSIILFLIHMLSAQWTKYKMSPSSWAVSCHYVFFLIVATTNNHKLSGLWLRIFVSFCRIRNPIQIKVSRELFTFQEGLEKFSFLAFSSIETTCISWLRAPFFYLQHQQGYLLPKILSLPTSNWSQPKMFSAFKQPYD